MPATESPCASCEKPRRRRWRVRLRRLSIVGGTIALLGYLSAATAVYTWLHFRQGVQVSCLDVLLPMRWANCRVARGTFFIERAEDAIRQQQWPEGLHLLRVGLAKAPRHLQGRLLLADLWLAAGRPDHARTVLNEGVAFHSDDPVFLQALFALLFAQQKDEESLAIARTLLTRKEYPAAARKLAALAAATACYLRGRYDQAEDFLRTQRLANTREGRLLAAQIESERGYGALALIQLRGLANEFPVDPEIYFALAALLREQGQTDEIRQRALLFQLAAPHDYRPRLDLLESARAASDQPRYAREAAEFLSDFATDQIALLALGGWAAHTGDVALTQQVRDHCRSRGMAWDAASLLVVEAFVSAGHFEAALQSARTLLAEQPGWAERLGSALASLQAIACFGRHDPGSAQQHLQRLFAQPDLRANHLLNLAHRLLDVGAESAARAVLQRAIEVDPLNQVALVRLISLDLMADNLASLPPLLHRLLTMRKPAKDLLRVAHFKLGSDRFLFLPGRDELLEKLEAALDDSPRLTAATGSRWHSNPAAE